MAESVIPAGTYTLQEFKLSPVANDAEVGDVEGIDTRVEFKDDTIDLKNIIHTWTIRESMSSGHVSGSAKVYDSEGIFYTYPIRGQEKIKITYTDYNQVEKTEYFFLYRVTDIDTPKPSDDSVLSYTLHFVSWGKFWSERFSVSRCIAEGTLSNRKYITIDKQVEVLFEDYFFDNQNGTEKPLRLHITEGEQKIVIPNMRPEGAMHLMSRRAYSVNFPSSYYRFFENREQYNFVNMEELNAGEVKKKFTYASGPTDNTPDGELAKMHGLISVAYQSPMDTFEALKNGAYYRKLEEVDITNRRVNAHEYTHHEDFIEYVYPGAESNINLLHTDEFIDSHLNDWAVTYAIKDYPDADQQNATGVRPKPYYGQIQNNKPAHAYDYKMTRANVKIYGHNDIFVGDLIELELPYFSVAGDIDKQRSGVYIIESIDNVFYENTYIQEMTVSKGPMGDYDV